ncbi:ISC system 2Fe-2S type ferredoxin [Candidatus Pseudomonas adelgestsugas]|uniref:2Fe-2S ferredoxin n=1 Tax=Candidatus Pseudomonas adelgestsugas TaxID=1302376 RepID=A0ABX5RB53_9PSED|nr:ISC system 2Fe-2S type ferredoxin [Candidatus Pseudomonas adelgestsugas]QAX82260.1 2Fe-2S ferredoxin [Candidatus Pseudomonas adelgestsugas]
MPQVIFLPHAKHCPDGMVVEAETGQSILEVAHDNHIELESACGGVCACTTCHCVIREGFQSLEEADELEENLLDCVWGLEITSRLSCQAKIGLGDIAVEIPKYSLNHAAEILH